MTDTDFSFINSDVPLNTVKPMDLKRTIAFTNFYLSQVAALLNNFAQTAERKILDIENRLERVETELVIVEEKLKSVPELSNIVLGSVPSVPTVSDTYQQPVPIPVAQEEPTVSQEMVTMESTATVLESAPVEETNVLKNCDDPLYSKYFKMLKMGVVEAAVRQKMIVEGLDPAILDNPNAPSTSKLVNTFEPESDGAASDSTECSYDSD